jgi:DNA-directed RNA polymerase subunit RPC12/RpoP
MNDSKAVCPRCKTEVHFEQQGPVARCPLCAFQYVLQTPPPLVSNPAKAESARYSLAQFIKIAAIVVLILLGTGTLLLGVLFVGCSLLLRS